MYGGFSQEYLLWYILLYWSFTGLHGLELFFGGGMAFWGDLARKLCLLKCKLPGNEIKTVDWGKEEKGTLGAILMLLFFQKKKGLQDSPEEGESEVF